MTGQRLGPYEVLSTLGEGGMGAVYRARDTKLQRDVALKVLRPEVANDAERLARFRREAQTLAALNHPHIGAIYGLEESGGTIALVLELVEGPTLADRIARGPAGEPDANAPASPELSPDGQRVAMWRGVQGNADIWLLDLLRGGMTRLTFEAAIETSPVWSPDGVRIAFGSNRTGVYDLYVKPSNGSAAETRLVASPNTKQALNWSPDGRWLLYSEVQPTTGSDLWALDTGSPDRTPHVVASTPAEEMHAQLSPDGRWMAYQTNESGRFEVVVQPRMDLLDSLFAPLDWLATSPAGQWVLLIGLVSVLDWFLYRRVRAWRAAQAFAVGYARALSAHAGKAG